jgi:hypothetical protein
MPPETFLVRAPVSSTPPHEVKVAIYLQAILFLRVIVTGVVAYTFFGEAKGHPVSAAVIVLLFTVIGSLWLYGLWRRRNWVRWLTVILNVVTVSDMLHKDIANGRGPDLVGYFLIAIHVAVTVMFLRPAASHWYRRAAG